jgi:hypothetical protein
MTINHLFLAFMGVVGAAVGVILVVKPETRDYRVSPYFWVLLAMALFELLAFRAWTRRSRNGRHHGCQGQWLPDGDRVDGGDTDRGGLVGVLINPAAGLIISNYLPVSRVSACERSPPRRAATLWQ